MRGVGDKAPLRVKGSFQPSEEPVNGVPEILELVGWSWQGEAFVQVLLRDLPGGGRYGLQRS